jgi:hypothetical protein
MTSFTPINQTQFQSINPRLLARALDSDSLYDINEENAAGLHIPKSRKRSAALGGRPVSFTPLWEYEDEGDLPQHNRSVALEESTPKRKRAAPKKRAESMVVPRDTLLQTWEHNGDVVEDEPQDSHLTTPPDSAIRRKSAVASKKKVQNPPFQNPVITKPSAARARVAKEMHPIQPSTQYQGFTTTEQQVGLAKTTLEKLGTFRYNPSQNDDQSSRRPMPLPNRGNPEPDLPSVYQPNSTPGLPFRHPPSSEGFFNKAMWCTDMAIDPFANDPMDVSATVASLPEMAQRDDYNCTDQHSMPGPRNFSDTQTLDGPISFLCPEMDGMPTEPDDLVGSTHEFVESSQHGHGYEEPTSSEVRLANDLMEAVNNASNEHSDLSPSKLQSGSPLITESEVGTNEISKPLHFVSTEDSDVLAETAIVVRGAPGSPQIQKDSINFCQPSSQLKHPWNKSELPGLSQPDIHCQLPFSSSELEIRQSGLDASATMGGEESRDVCASDEFDGGLDDEDLLTVALKPAIPQTPAKHYPEGRNYPHLSEAPDETVSPIPIVQPNVSLEARHPDRAFHYIPSRVPYVEYDEVYGDEFAMDEGDEEELLKLAEFTENVVETFAPPASVQDAFDINSDTGEVYDSSLQFSPPKSKAVVVAQGKVAEARDTNKSSNNQLLQRQSNREPPLGAEEDWSFIRSDEDSDPFLDATPPAIIARSKTQHASSSPAKRSVSMHSRAPTTMSQFSTRAVIDDSHEYEPLQPFARPPFPNLVLDRCPIVGVSARTSLRVCFRVGEMYREGARCNSAGLDVVLELFARVGFSSREPGTTIQHFQFLDLWHDRPPYAPGILMNYKTTGLAESESKIFLEGKMGKMARCLTRLKRDAKSKMGWLLNIINIRETDWEEIRWTKRIVSGDDLAKRMQDGFKDGMDED